MTFADKIIFETVPEKYAKRVCNMIGMLGLRGISVLESAGDTGKFPFQYVFLSLGISDTIMIIADARF